MPCKNQQSANAHVFNDNILTSKADLSISCMIPKAAFTEDVNDADNDFKVVVHGYKCGGSRLSDLDT